MNEKGKQILRFAIINFIISVVLGICLGLFCRHFIDLSSGEAASIAGIGIGLLNGIGMIGYLAGLNTAGK